MNSMAQLRENNMLTKLYVFLLFMYFLLNPFYFFNSGTPQIADIILVFLFLLILFTANFHLEGRSKLFVITSILFVYYVCTVNGVWSILLGGNTELLIRSSFYIFNLIACLLIILLYKKLGDRLLHFIFYAVALSLIIQLLIYMFVPTSFKGGARTINFFNNPNQLGYYALLSQSILFLLVKKINVKKFVFILAFISSFTLTLVSLSKGALAAFLIMYLMFTIFIYKRKQLFRVNALFLFVLLCFSILLNTDRINYNFNIPVLDILESRINTAIERNDDSGAYRGYDRILMFPEYLVLGAGEGAVYRFEGTRHGEIHSTLGNLLFSYGIIGLSLFVLVILISIKGRSLVEYYPLLPPFIYGLTHNGIRSTLLWFLIVIVVIIPKDKQNKYEAS